MRYRASLTWIVVWVLMAQLALAGPAPAAALSAASSEAPKSALDLADLQVSPEADLLQVVRAALDTAGPGGAEGPDTYTDDEGLYRFVGLPLGTHKVTIDARTLPPRFQPQVDEAPIVLWVVPGMEEVSAALSTGVRFSVRYDLGSGEISGYVYWDQDGDGQMGGGEPGLSGVRVIDPTLHQYFVPFDDRDLWRLFEDKASCHEPPMGDQRLQACFPLVSRVFIVAGSDGTVFFYDHWEDGYDPDPVNPGAGSSTEVGVLDAGATRIFASDIDPSQIGSLSLLYYDGRDRITIRGEDANVVRLANASSVRRPWEGDPACLPGGGGGEPGSSGWLAAAWEVPEVAEWGTEYHTIVGEDLDVGAGAAEDHDFAGLEVMAWQDDTSISYAGGAPVVIDAGETLYVPGVGPAGGSSGVQSSDHLSADKPVQVQMMTGGCSSDIVSAHGYTLIPERSWGNAYWAPVPGFDETAYCSLDRPTTTDVDTDIYLHNPDLVDDIVVTVQSGASTADLSVGPHTTISVLDATGWGDLAPDNVGTYLFSDDYFWGLVAVDSATDGASGSDDYDWGYSLLPESELSSQVVIGYGPGRPANRPDLDNGNVAFVVAVVTTTLYVDLNQDGLPDPFDMDGDGEYSSVDVWGVDAWDEPVSALGVEVGAGQVLRVADPFDYQLRGARIYTRDLQEHIAVAWGQDPCTTERVGYLDLGYTVLANPVPRLDKSASLAVDADATGDISRGDTVTYTLVMVNNGRSDMSQVWLTDTLPYTESTFIQNSLSVSLPPQTIEYLDGGVWGPDSVAGAEAFRVYWPTIMPDEVVTLTFRSRILATTPADEMLNQAVVDSANTDPVTASATTPIVRPNLALTKLVNRPQVNRGEPFTYTIIVSNTDTNTGAAIGTRIWDVLPPDVTYVPGTLALEWPVEQVWYDSVPVSRTTFFHGVYADNLDQDPGGSTGYAGSDGSLDWSTEWIEVGESDGAGAGSLQVVVDEPNALSAPAYIWMGNLAGAGAGLTRDLDLSDFVSPTVRFHRAGSAGIAGEYYLTVGGVLIAGSRESHAGDYGIREFTLAAGTYGVETLGLMVDGMAAGDVYRFDHISVYERQSARPGTAMLSRRYSRLDPRSVSGIDPVSYDPSSGSVVITDSLRLPAMGVVTATLSVVVDPTLIVTETLYLTNTAYVRAENRPETLQDTAVVSITANTADLAIQKFDDPDPVITADSRTLTYTLVYTNSGPLDAQSVTLTDTLPSDVIYGGVESQPAGWSVPTVSSGPPTTLSWFTQTLAAGQSGTFVLTVTVSQGFAGVLTNQADISTETPESRYDNNQDQEQTEVDPTADVAITKVGQPDLASPGDELVYTLVYTNNGPHTAQNVVVSDTLIPEIQFEEARPAPVPPTDTVLRWELGALVPGESGTIVVTTTVTAAAVETFTNTAQISTITPETDYTNNVDDDPTDVPANVTIVKSGAPDLVSPGDELVYTLVYINEGPAAAQNVVVSDTLIPEIQFEEASPAPVPPTDTVLRWELGTLLSGESGTIVVTTTVTAAAIEAFTNTVQISTITPESRYDDNWDDEATELELADVAIQKTVSHREAAPGESLVYTLTYQNLGDVPARDVVVWDDLPEEILFDRAVPAPDRRPDPLRWDIGMLDVGASGTILVYAHVRDDLEDGALVQNVARIETSTAESDYTNNQDSAPTPVGLISFTVQPVPEAVVVEWETAWEIRTYGFYVYRGESDRWDDAVPIAFVWAAGHGHSDGARYRYKDLDVVPEGTYHYWLVDVDIDRRETRHGPRVVTALPEMSHHVYLSFVQLPQMTGVAAGETDE